MSTTTCTQPGCSSIDSDYGTGPGGCSWAGGTCTKEATVHLSRCYVDSDPNASACRELCTQHAIYEVEILSDVTVDGTADLTLTLTALTKGSRR